MENFLHAQIGSQLRKVKIIDIKKELINANDRESEKIVFTVFDNTVKREFKISDCWIEAGHSLKISGLWYLANDTGIISPNSALAKILSHYGYQSLAEMLGKEITVYPDPKGYLVLVGCPCNEKLLEDSLDLLKQK